MKKLTIEEKARAYDEAKARMSRAWNDNRCTLSFMDEIFPELQESEDEKIKKTLIDYMASIIDINGITGETIVAWLEKQGEKPTNKIEPKFKVGDWIIFNENHISIYQVERIDDYRYYLRHYLGGTLSVHFDSELIRPWTIQDAKDGDVLVYEGYYNSIVLFKGIGINGKGRINYHAKCDLGNYSFNIQGDVACMGTVESSASYYHPATKEQRDLLFQKMKEAGYEWDNEKKEVKKIEHKITDNEDERIMKWIINHLKYNFLNTSIADERNKCKEAIDWLEKQVVWKPTKEQMELLKETIDKYYFDLDGLCPLYVLYRELENIGIRE